MEPAQALTRESVLARIETARGSEMAVPLLEFAASRGEAGNLDALQAASAIAELSERVAEEPLLRSLGRSLVQYAVQYPERHVEEKWLRQLPREDREFVYTGSLRESLDEPSLESAALRFSRILQMVGRERGLALLLEAAAWSDDSRDLEVSTSLAGVLIAHETAPWRTVAVRLLEALRFRASGLPHRGIRTIEEPIDYVARMTSALHDDDPRRAIVWLRAAEAERCAGAQIASVRAGIRRWLREEGDRPNPGPAVSNLAQPLETRLQWTPRPVPRAWTTLLESTLPSLGDGRAESFLVIHGLCRIAERLPHLAETAHRVACDWPALESDAGPKSDDPRRPADPGVGSC